MESIEPFGNSRVKEECDSLPHAAWWSVCRRRTTTANQHRVLFTVLRHQHGLAFSSPAPTYPDFTDPVTDDALCGVTDVSKGLHDFLAHSSCESSGLYVMRRMVQQAVEVCFVGRGVVLERVGVGGLDAGQKRQFGRASVDRSVFDATSRYRGNT